MKLWSNKRIVFGVLVGALAASAVLANNIPLRNWTVPGNAAGEITKATDRTFGIAFVGVDPCRIVDTRGPTGPYGAPSMVANVTRDFDLDGGPCTGIPAGVDAYSLNITVTNTAGPGVIKIFPQGGVQPVVSTLNYVAGQTIANAAIVPAGTGGGVTVIAGVSGTDLIIDINGYFSDALNTPNYFSVESDYSGGGGVIFGNNLNTTAAGFGGHFRSQSPMNGAAGVRGRADAVTGEVHGVFGTTSSTTALASGVRGTADGGGTYGVYGSNSAVSFTIGVRGEAGFRGVEGQALANLSCGVCGLGFGGVTGSSGVSAFPSSGGTPFAALYTTGNFVALGTKSFVEPHALDASKQINYIAIESPEPRTFFTGRGKFDRGLARIAVPEHFRLITDGESLTVQVTPIGAMASVAVKKVDLSEIVVQSSRSVEFFYTVTGVRKSFRDHNPVEPNAVFRPDAAGGRDIRGDISAAAKEAMMRNGSLNSDGSWNEEKARQLGWKLPEPPEEK